MQSSHRLVMRRSLSSAAGHTAVRVYVARRGGGDLIHLFDRVGDAGKRVSPSFLLAFRIISWIYPKPVSFVVNAWISSSLITLLDLVSDNDSFGEATLEQTGTRASLSIA